MHELPVPEFQSRYEVLHAGVTRFDYKTAHTRAGDSRHTLWLPETCSKCWAQELEAKELGWVPTSPDQEIPEAVTRGLT